MISHSSSFSRTLLFSALLALLAACGGGGGGENDKAPTASEVDAPDGDTSDQSGSSDSDGSTGVSTEAQCEQSESCLDLAAYLFPAAVLESGGRVDVTESMYSQDDGQLQFSLSRAYVENNGAIDEYASGEIEKSQTITESQIEERFYDPEDSRVSARFAAFGDVYMDADSEASASEDFSLQQNARCQLITEYAEFDLAGATGEHNLASGSYDQVIEVECVTSYIVDGDIVPHTTLTSYFAKNTGLILSKGSVILLGDIYVVERY